MGEQSPHTGGSPVLFQHLFWFFGHPEVYIVALPAFGVVSDILATHARKNIFGYRMMVWAMPARPSSGALMWYKAFRRYLAYDQRKRGEN